MQQDLTHPCNYIQAGKSISLYITHMYTGVHSDVAQESCTYQTTINIMQ